PQVLYQYEEATHFRCYPLERNPSISANAHVLDALRYGPPGAESRRRKIIHFLEQVRQPGGFWFDKWHASPYYATSHVILAAHDQAPELVGTAIAWLLRSQADDGSWGFFFPTLEETAYALLALLVWRDAGHPIPAVVLERAVAYLP